jgi:hypothetical protein
MYNVTLALLTVFIIIILLSKYDNFVEGMDNIETPDTIGEENVPITGKQQVLTKDAVTKDAVKKDEIKQNINDRISDLKAKAQQQANTTTTTSTTDSNMGMDKEDIKNAIQSMPANSIPTDKSMFNSNDNVQPLTSSMLTNKSSLTEGFCPCAASVVF